MDRKKEKAEYAGIYGTNPCALEITDSVFNNSEAYLGSRIENKTIVFMFDNLPFADSLSAGSVIELHFRSRLSRKISIDFEKNTFSVPISSDEDELEDYMTAMFDLELYFRGIIHSPRLEAELKIFDQGKDWRNKELLIQAMQSAQTN